MRILIAYASKSGTARAAAELLAAHLQGQEVTVTDLEKNHTVSGDFDHIVVGGSVRMGKAHKALRRFLKENGAEIAAVPHTLFLCCGIPEQFENYLRRTFSPDLLDSAEDAVYFGGELDVSKQKGFDKWVARMIRNAIRDSEDDEAGLPGLLPEHVRMLADRLCGKR